MISNHPDALRHLTTGAPGSAALRARLVERFVPSWSDVLGPISRHSERDLLLVLDRLEVRRALAARRLRYDVERRIYEEMPAGTGPASTMR